jgi:hypothetical protein
MISTEKKTTRSGDQAWEISGVKGTEGDPCPQGGPPLDRASHRQRAMDLTVEWFKKFL